MFWQVLGLVLLAPLVACVATWVLWMAVVAWDWVWSGCRAWYYQRRVVNCPQLVDLDERGLAERIWESYWLIKRCSFPRSWSRDDLHDHLLALQDQLYLLQVSREAHELWQSSSQSYYYPAAKTYLHD